MVKPESYAVGWIAALQHELTAALEMLDQEHGPPEGFHKHSRDDNSYTWGQVGKHYVVIAGLPEGTVGKVAAGTTAMHMLMSLPHLRIGLLVGIGAGVPFQVGPDGLPDIQLDIRLGDVVVSEPKDRQRAVVQYDYCKAEPTSSKLKGDLAAPPRAFLTALKTVRSQHERRDPKFLEYLDTFARNGRMRGYTYPGPGNDRLESVSGKGRKRSPKVHYGTIASGDTVVKSGAERIRILRMLREHDVQPQCLEMEAAGVVDCFPCLVIRGVCDYADEHKNDVWHKYAAATAAAYAKELLGYVDVAQVESSPKIGDVLKGVSSLREMTINRDIKTSLLSLAVAKGASFDSKDEDELPKCLPDTRVEILDHIERWATDPNGKPIFWLHGKAGTGKSTISRTVAGLLRRKGSLAGSFFFKRTEDRGNASKFFTTLASQLATKYPELRYRLAKTIEDDPFLVSKSFKEQFERLVLEPLVILRESVPGNNQLVVVVDALDECDPEQDVRILIQLLGRAKNGLSQRLRLFVTSRPELPIRREFRKLSEEMHLDNDLHLLDEDTIAHDIQVFLEHEFDKIRQLADDPLPPDWPGQENIDMLLMTAIPLFIFAATICRFVGDQIGDPRERLEAVLAGPRTSPQSSQLEKTYLPIFERITANRNEIESRRITEDFLAILGAIVVLRDPLSAQALSSLLQISLLDLNAKLRWLHSVLHIPDDTTRSITLHHLSFYDFLVDPDRCGRSPFWVNERTVHARLASHCIQLLSSRLQTDICGFGYPGMRKEDAEPGIVSASLPADVRYACLHWVQHLVQSGESVDDDHEAWQFLETHFLHWLEARSWLARLSEVSIDLRRLHSIVETSGDKMKAFLEDAQQFFVHNQSIIDAAPLQLYYSCLAFAQSGSLVKSSSQDTNLSYELFGTPPRVPTVWGDEILKCQMPSPVTAVATSPDGRVFVSGSFDGTIQFWDSDTGHKLQLVHRKEGFWGSCSLAISPDGQFLVFGGTGCTVWIHRVSTGEQAGDALPEHTCPISPSGNVPCVAFAADGRLVACACECGSLFLWIVSAYTGDGSSNIFEPMAQAPWTLPDPDGRSLANILMRQKLGLKPAEEPSQELLRFVCRISRLKTLAFAADGKTIAWYSNDGSAGLWDIANVERSFTLTYDDHCSMALLPQGDLIALGCIEGQIQLWDLCSRQPSYRLNGHTTSVGSLAFSSDGKFLVSGSEDSTARLWSIDTGQQLRVFRGHQGPVRSVCLLPKGLGRSIASGGEDETVRLWLPFEHEPDGFENPIKVTTVAVSENSKLFASGCESGEVKLWDGRSLRSLDPELKFEGQIQTLAFGSGGRTLAVAYAGTDNKSRVRTVVQVWDIASRRKTLVIEAKNRVYGLVFSPDGDTLAEVATFWSVRLWDLKPRWSTRIAGYLSPKEPSLEFFYDQPDNAEIHQGRLITSVAFSGNSETLALARHDGIITFRSLAEGTDRVVDRRTERDDWTRAMAFHPDGRRLALLTLDTIHILDIATGQLQHQFVTKKHSAFYEPAQVRFHGEYLLSSAANFLLRNETSTSEKSRSESLLPQLELTREWLRYRGHDLLWIPLEHRGSAVALHGNTISFGHTTDTFSFLEFDEKRVQELIRKWEISTSWKK